ncbi:cystinosin homolog isoform X1 [Phlebotomus papatasi]|uniref:cystinosin homolog isoform X1 n=1 Tax=Phlebotomus papatasi TaxID=29031 RepID=UPI0024833296|nr:cystinosin homolog isoform X1 [Phlebotomus papatasi]XP_055698213.1 cystinosin homolog isoform X1 [Phlebotomus papatasi]XP_055698214.1 cystinosin homolog isoform X1 [Phlebotomus papatasi]
MRKVNFHSVLFFIASTAVLLLSGQTNAQTNQLFTLSVSTQDLTVLVGETTEFNLEFRGFLNETGKVYFYDQHDGLIDVIPRVLELQPSAQPNNEILYPIRVEGLNPGHLEVTSNYTIGGRSFPGENLFVRITVAISEIIIYVSIVVGWVYFVAWSISFYPQIYYNFQRKSVVGLNPDFLALNIVGFVMYSVFNMGLFWNPGIQAEYFERFPRGLNPVLVNDVVFSLHAAFATLVTIGQCFIYERGDQRVSNVARGILGIFAVVVIVCAILAATDTFHWLDFLYACSYIKLTITLIKYVPQALMNYRRKSTVGWSIGNILLDFTGGILSMLQMMLNAHNYDDWDSIFGDPTKFGLGLFSVCFDVVFIIQHYVLYRNATPYEELAGQNIAAEEPQQSPETAEEEDEAPSN